MQFVLFTALAVLLYFVSDRLLGALEARAGRSFENRTLIFFVILLVLALVSFSLVQRLVGGETGR